MKKLYYLLTLILAISLIAACSNDAGNSEPNEEAVPQETDSEEVDDTTTDDSNEEDTEAEADEDAGSDISFKDDIKYLQIGETGSFRATIGSYEITPESYEFIDSYGDGKTSNYGNLIEFTLRFKNLSDKPLETVSLLYTNGRVIPLSDEIIFGLSVHVTDEVEFIEPNETVTMKVVYDAIEDDEYHLAFGDQMTSNEIHWEFPGK
ncbi:hypothetical protein [Robertmurraya massiliosenegalensis]|uniref:hypothetical protein n=1 Tax=Robertmurraya massiliosenegalensis TaxID=1287657 RepID=UPI00031C3E80|nr:hypothetical protein [Robertmurraya massiliosenegalensis]